MLLFNFYRLLLDNLKLRQNQEYAHVLRFRYLIIDKKIIINKIPNKEKNILAQDFKKLMEISRIS